MSRMNLCIKVATTNQSRIGSDYQRTAFRNELKIKNIGKLKVGTFVETFLKIRAQIERVSLNPHGFQILLLKNEHVKLLAGLSRERGDGGFNKITLILQWGPDNFHSESDSGCCITL